jgi:hypothetical protein
LFDYGCEVGAEDLFGEGEFFRVFLVKDLFSFGFLELLLVPGRNGRDLGVRAARLAGPLAQDKQGVVALFGRI